MSDSSKAIGSLAKRQSEVTRQGTQKLKFVPTLPAKRKKEEIKAEPPAPSTHAAENSLDRGEGRGKGKGRALPRQLTEMTASGPFAMGPALSGNVSRRSIPRSNVAPLLMSPASASTTRTTITNFTALEGVLKSLTTAEDEEFYSEPDEGIEIVDMQKVRELDWMAPETLRKERKKAKSVKKEEETEEVDTSNAIDLSESGGEEEFEGIVEDFAQANMNEGSSHREKKLLFFQFPAPFPIFYPDSGPSTKKVAFTSNVQSGSATSSATSSTKPDQLHEHQIPDLVDGIIGQLEVYRSGAVKFRLSSGILFDVSTAIQPTFLQQAVYLQRSERYMIVVGDVSKRFVVSPDVDTLLMAMDEVGQAPTCLLDSEDMLVKMDAT